MYAQAGKHRNKVWFTWAIHNGANWQDDGAKKKDTMGLGKKCEWG